MPAPSRTEPRREWPPKTHPGFAQKLLRIGIGSALIKALSLPLSLALSIILARTLAPEEFGLYSFVIALSTIMAVVPQFGLPGLILRETGRAMATEDYGRMLGSWLWSGRLAFRVCVGITGAGVLAVPLLGHFVPALGSSAYYWSLLLIPLLSLGALRGAALRGLGKVAQGLLPEFVLTPALFVGSIGVIWLYDPSSLDAANAMVVHAASAGIAFLVGLALLSKSRPAAMKATTAPTYDIENWKTSVIPMAAIMGVAIIVKHTDIVMVGLLMTDERVGVYRVAAHWSLIIMLGSQIVGFVTPSYFAQFHASGDSARLQKLATQSARVGALLGLPPLLAFLFFGRPIIGFVFGAEYADAYPPLAILSLGQYAGVLMGSCGIMLAMMNLERASARIMALSALANVLLNALFIPRWGLTGAAVASSLTLALHPVILARVVWTQLGINSTPFGRTAR